jgi:predicted nucleotidyltransferase
MGSHRELVEAKRDEICAIVRRHRGRSVAIFGSVARGDESSTSDIDFLVDFESGSSLFDLLHLTEELEMLLGVPVDVVSAGRHSPRVSCTAGRRSGCSRSSGRRALPSATSSRWPDPVWQIAAVAVPDLARQLSDDGDTDF